MSGIYLFSGRLIYKLIYKKFHTFRSPALVAVVNKISVAIIWRKNLRVKKVFVIDQTDEFAANGHLALLQRFHEGNTSSADQSLSKRQLEFFYLNWSPFNSRILNARIQAQK